MSEPTPASPGLPTPDPRARPDRGTAPVPNNAGPPARREADTARKILDTASAPASAPASATASATPGAANASGAASIGGSASTIDARDVRTATLAQASLEFRYVDDHSVEVLSAAHDDAFGRLTGLGDGSPTLLEIRGQPAPPPPTPGERTTATGTAPPTHGPTPETLLEAGVGALPSTPPAGTPPGIGADTTGVVSFEDLLAGSFRHEKYGARHEIGRGGLGAVLEVHDRDLRRHVAMKVLHPRWQQDPAHRARFVREAQLTGQLEHPHIVPVHDLGLDPDGHLYFTMKRIRGESLEEIIGRIRQDPARAPMLFPLTRRLELVKRVGEALAFAHARGVVHRDLKPGNILVGGYGEVQLVDWGLAALQDAPPHVARSAPIASDETHDAISLVHVEDARLSSRRQRVVAGTPAYMPPEQALGEVATRASDVFGLGAILYALVTLRPPYEGRSLFDVLAAAKLAVAPSPRSIAPQPVAKELNAIIEKAMARRPEDRYATPIALIDDLTRFQEGFSVYARPANPVVAAVKWARRHRGVALTATVMFGVMVALFVYRATRPGQVTVGSTPSGATVLIDGSFRGTTPIDTPFELAPGTHTLRFVLDGHHAVETTVSVTSGQRGKLAEPFLRSSRGRVFVATDPPGSSVAVLDAGGRAVAQGVGPWLTPPLEHGDYRVRVTRLGYRDPEAQAPVTVKDGNDTATVNRTLIATTGRLSVTTTPPGATITLVPLRLDAADADRWRAADAAGELSLSQQGVTPWQSPPLPAGVYRLMVRRAEDHVDPVRQHFVDVPDRGRTTRLAIPLRDVRGKVSVTLNRPGLNVRLLDAQGQEVLAAKAPFLSGLIPAGRYRLALDSQDFAIVGDPSVTVPDGGETVLKEVELRRITGQLVVDTGESAAGATLALRGPEDKTVTLPSPPVLLAPGAYQATLSRPGAYPLSFRFEASPQAPVRLGASLEPIVKASGLWGTARHADAGPGGGRLLSVDGDFDLDGARDAVVLAGRHVRVISVLRDEPLWRPIAIPAGAKPAEVTARVVDLDADGADDLLIGAGDLVQAFRGPSGTLVMVKDGRSRVGVRGVWAHGAAEAKDRMIVVATADALVAYAGARYEFAFRIPLPTGAAAGPIELAWLDLKGGPGPFAALETAAGVTIVDRVGRVWARHPDVHLLAATRDRVYVLVAERVYALSAEAFVSAPEPLDVVPLTPLIASDVSRAWLTPEGLVAVITTPDGPALVLERRATAPPSPAPPPAPAAGESGDAPAPATALAKVTRVPLAEAPVQCVRLARPEGAVLALIDPSGGLTLMTPEGVVLATAKLPRPEPPKSPAGAAPAPEAEAAAVHWLAFDGDGDGRDELFTVASASGQLFRVDLDHEARVFALKQELETLLVDVALTPDGPRWIIGSRSSLLALDPDGRVVGSWAGLAPGDLLVVRGTWCVRAHADGTFERLFPAHAVRMARALSTPPESGPVPGGSYLAASGRGVFVAGPAGVWVARLSGTEITSEDVAIDDATGVIVKAWWEPRLGLVNAHASGWVTGARPASAPGIVGALLLRQALKERDRPRAMRRLLKPLRTNLPRCPRVLWLVGVNARARREPQEAERYWRRALERDPNLLSARYALAVSQTERGEWSAVRTLLDPVLLGRYQLAHTLWLLVQEAYRRQDHLRTGLLLEQLEAGDPAVDPDFTRLRDPEKNATLGSIKNWLDRQKD